MMLNKDYRQNQIDFLKSHYNETIVNAAIEYADHEIKYGVSFKFDDAWLQCIRNNAEALGADDILTYVDYLSGDRTDRQFNALTFAYVYGMTNGIRNSNVRITPEPTSEYVLNKDFAFFFYFTDNDFGGYLRDAAEKYCKEYNDLLRTIDLWSRDNDNNYTLNSSIKSLEFMEKPENIINVLKGSFIGSYMSGMADRCWLGDVETYSKRLKRAEELITYLAFDNEDRWKIGTWIDVNQEGLTKFRNMQSDEDFEKANGDFSNYWLNGEVLIVKMVNNHLKVVKA